MGVPRKKEKSVSTDSLEVIICAYTSKPNESAYTVVARTHSNC